MNPHRISRNRRLLACDISQLKRDAAPPPPPTYTDERLLQQEVICRLLDYLSQGRKAGPAVVGARVIVLAHYVRGKHLRSQRDLAKRLGVTEGRASAMVKSIREKLGEIL